MTYSHKTHRLAIARATAALIVLTCPLSASHAAVFMLGDGDSLVAAVAAAEHGDIIELHSDQPFAGTINWRDKHLTIRAGDGYRPTIDGVIGPISGAHGSGAGGGFQDLTIRNFLQSGTGSREAQFSFDNVVFQRDFSMSGTGELRNEVQINNVVFQRNFRLSGTGDLRHAVQVNDSTFLGDFSVSGTGSLVTSGVISNSRFMGSVGVSGNSLASYHLEFLENDFDNRASVTSFGATAGLNVREVRFERNRLRNGLLASASQYNHLDLVIANNLLGGEDTPPSVSAAGINVQSISGDLSIGDTDVTVEIINNTILGFDTGIEIRGVDLSADSVDLLIANTLLVNDDDLLNVPSGVISHSIIADGTHAGVNSNQAEMPLLGPTGELLAGSSGIDQGSNSAAYGLIDFKGAPRLSDGDGDGIATIDIGAYEFVVPEPSSAILGILSLCMATRYRGRSRGAKVRAI